MNLMIKGILISTFLVVAVNASEAQTASSGMEPRKPHSQAPNALLMRCLYLVSGDATAASATAPAQSLGFNFVLQKHNNNGVAVDVYSLTTDRKPIKQVAHADMVGSISAGSSDLTLAEDSPFEMAVSISGTTATVTTMTTFLGETYTGLTLQCLSTPSPAADLQTQRLGEVP